MTSIIPEFDIEASDVEHIKRLRKLREAGDDMETSEELKSSLLARFGEPEATETFNWAINCSVESAEGVGIKLFCARFRAAVERVKRWNLGRESEDQSHWVDRSNSSTTKSEIIAPSEIVILVLSSDSTEHFSPIWRRQPSESHSLRRLEREGWSLLATRAT